MRNLVNEEVNANYVSLDHSREAVTSKVEQFNESKKDVVKIENMIEGICPLNNIVVRADNGIQKSAVAEIVAYFKKTYNIDDYYNTVVKRNNYTRAVLNDKCVLDTNCDENNDESDSEEDLCLSTLNNNAMPSSEVSDSTNLNYKKENNQKSTNKNKTNNQTDYKRDSSDPSSTKDEENVNKKETNPLIDHSNINGPTQSEISEKDCVRSSLSSDEILKQLKIDKMNTNMHRKFHRGGNTVTGSLESDLFRIYKTNVKYDVTIGQRKYSDLVPIFYRIGARFGIKRGLSSPTLKTNIMASSQTVVTNVSILQDMCKAAQKYSNYHNTFNCYDLSAVIEQLAAGVATYTHFGVLPFEALKGHMRVNLVALHEHDVRMSPSSNVVFVPAMCNERLVPSMFCALLCAVSACGGTVVTDTVNLDANTRRPIYSRFENAELASGCVAMLQQLATQYNECGAGDVFAYAYSRGLTRVMTVVGHTDEGSFMRRVLRTGSFVTPYGGISCKMPKISTIPTPLSDDVASYRSVFDSSALLIAALVAESDPGVVVNEKIVPFVSSCENELPNSAYGYHHHQMISNNCGAFITRYIKGLSLGLGMTTISTTAANHLKCVMQSSTLSNDRHLKRQTVAPWYWIEPTSIISHSIALELHVSDAIGSFSYTNFTVNEKMFSGEVSISANWLSEYCLQFEYTNMRESLLLRWLAMRVEDGLANMKLTQCDDGQFCCVGPNFDYSKLTDGNRNNFVTMQDLRWRSLDNNVPKPSEGMYTSSGVEVCVNWVGYDDNDDNIMNPVTGVMPSPDELYDSHGSTTVTMLCSVGFGGIATLPAGDCKRITRGLRVIKKCLKFMMSNVKYSSVPVFVNKDVVFTKSAYKPPNIIKSDHIVHSTDAGLSHTNVQGNQVMGSIDVTRRNKLADNTVYMPIAPEAAKQVRGQGIGTEPISVNIPTKATPAVGTDNTGDKADMGVVNDAHSGGTHPEGSNQ